MGDPILVGKVPDVSRTCPGCPNLSSYWWGHDHFAGHWHSYPLESLVRACPWVWVITVIRERITVIHDSYTVISHVLTRVPKARIFVSRVLIFSAFGTSFWGHVPRVPTHVPRVSRMCPEKREKSGQPIRDIPNQGSDVQSFPCIVKISSLLRIKLEMGAHSKVFPRFLFATLHRESKAKTNLVANATVNKIFR